MNVMINMTRDNLEKYLWGGGLETWLSLSDNERANAWACIEDMARECIDDGRTIMLSEINAFMWFDYHGNELDEED